MLYFAAEEMYAFKKVGSAALACEKAEFTWAITMMSSLVTCNGVLNIDNG